MKKILLISTGGTIASVRTEEGLRPGLSAEELLRYVPEVYAYCSVEYLQLCSIDSTNMTPHIWSRIVEVLEQEYDHYDGFVITHGTDTMAYTSAALSYMVQNSRKPIVITGSQKPINLDGTDAKANLRDSILYACDDSSQDVVLVFDGNVIAGTRAKKMMSRSWNAFGSVNFPALAKIIDGRIIRFIPYVPVSKPVVFQKDISGSVCVMKLIPGSEPELLGYLFGNYDCIVIESFGVGGIPDRLMDKFCSEMEKWAGKGKFIIIATQVVNEGSDMEIYQVGQKVKKDYKLIEAYDMTLEATVTKAMWLMAKYPGRYQEVRSDFYRTINYDILCAEV